VISKFADGLLGGTNMSEGGVCAPGGDGVVPADQAGFSGASYSCDEGDDDKTDAMWGGKGHDVVHVLKEVKGYTYCMQVSGKKVADDATYRVQ
jgi:hypothetical protein